jgi:uroporphyrin-III C-methyltransferase
VSDNNDKTPGEDKATDEALETGVAETEVAAAGEAEKSEPVAKQKAPQVAPAASPQAAPPPAKKGTSFIGWLALLLVLALAGAAGWSLQQGLQREAQLKDRIADLENRGGVEKSDLQQLRTAFQRDLKQGLEKVGGEATRQAQMLDSLQSQISDQQERLASFSANDHDSWLRAEAQYLLRLANQRLIMAQDVVSAQALLGSADAIIQELDDAGLYDVRAAIAAEQAALRAVPKIDVEGIYLRLSALIEQADRLVIFQMLEQEAQPEREHSDDWQVRLERGYEEAARKLSDYIVIRRRDVPMHALMDPQWEGLVRQNLRMLLEQAQVALLSGNQTLYQESLERSQHWVSQFFESDEAAARAMSSEIDQLSTLTVETSMPDLTRSLRALDEAMKGRLQQGGAK